MVGRNKVNKPSNRKGNTKGKPSNRKGNTKGSHGHGQVGKKGVSGGHGKAKGLDKNKNRGRKHNNRGIHGLRKLCGTGNAQNEGTTVHKTSVTYGDNKIHTREAESRTGKDKVTEELTEEKAIKNMNKTLDRIREADTNETMFISIVDLNEKDENGNHKKYNILRKNFDMKMERTMETGILVLDTKPLEFVKVGGKYIIGVVTTTDPSLMEAFDVVSLGNFMCAFMFKECELVNNNPPTFTGWSRKFTIRLLTPLRDE